MLHLIHSVKADSSTATQVAEFTPNVPFALSYAEASYFEGFHYQHIAEWEDRKRIQRLKRYQRRA